MRTWTAKDVLDRLESLPPEATISVFDPRDYIGGGARNWDYNLLGFIRSTAGKVGLRILDTLNAGDDCPDRGYTIKQLHGDIAALFNGFENDIFFIVDLTYYDVLESFSIDLLDDDHVQITLQ